MRVNQKILAEKLGVSQMTISKALRGEPDISEKTVRKVLESARKHGYRSNRFARGLADGRTGIIGALMPRSRGNYYSVIWDTIEDEVIAAGYVPLFIRLGFNPSADEFIIEKFMQYHPEGLIVCPRSKDWQKDYFSRSLRAGQKIVFIGDAFIQGCCRIHNDDFHGAEEAVKYLISLGHRNIAMVSGRKDTILEYEKDREMGYCKALKDAKISMTPDYLINSESHQDIQRLVCECLERHPEITAFFCNIDEVAMESCLALRKIGKKVPEDISVMGFANNIQHPEYSLIPLTTMAHDPQKVGKTAVEKLIKIMNWEKTAGEFPIPNKLIVRESTGCCRKGISDQSSVILTDN